jgi:molecular chaperone DnaK
VDPIGIDFGTTNSVVAAYGGGGVDVLPIDTPPRGWEGLGLERIMPSVVGVVGATNEASYGWGAKVNAPKKLEAVKRLFATEDSVRIGGAEYDIEMAAALLFARLKERAAECGAQVDRAVVTVPANSRGLARYRTKLCAGLAGIDVVALINEPTAAAMAHSISVADDQNILVFDWGGGTLDVTVLETVAGVFIERASKGIQRSGGIDLDKLFGEAILEQLPDRTRWDETARDIFWLEVEKAKIRLSTEDETPLTLHGDRLYPVGRELLERAIRPKIEETRGPIDQCLRDLGITASGIDHLVLVGGSSKIPAVRRFVAEVLAKEPAVGADAITAVGEGAALAAAILAGQLDNDFFVATEHALGTIAADEYERESFSVLIPRNHKLPAKAEGSYRPLHEGQSSVLVRVIEGDPAATLDDPDNVILAEWPAPVDPERSLDESGFTILYEYDVDGILHVRVTDDLTGDSMLSQDVAFGVRRDKSALVAIAKSVEATMSSGRLGNGSPSPVGPAPAASLDSQSQAAVERARKKIIPFIDEEEAARLEELCRDLETADPADVEACRAALETAMRKYAYLF